MPNVLAKSVALCPGNTITRELISGICDVPYTEDEPAEQPLSERSLKQVEKAHISLILQNTHWHKGQACEILGISRPRLRRLIKQFGLIPPADIADNEQDEDNENDEEE